MAVARLSAVHSVDGGARDDETSDSDDDTIDTDGEYSRRSSIYSRRSSMKLDDDEPASENEEAAPMVSGVAATSPFLTPPRPREHPRPHST